MQRKPRILVVDDDADIRELVVTICADNGAEALGVSDGVMLLKVIEARKHLDLVVLDVMMKTVNGLEALKQIRAAEHLGAYTPVHLITGYRDPRLISLAEKLGIAGYSIKPFVEEELWAALSAEMLPQISMEEVRSLLTHLHVQDVKLFEDVKDRRLERNQYRFYPVLWKEHAVAIAVRNPFLPRHLLDLPDAQIVETIRVYHADRRGSQLIWPTFFAQAAAAASSSSSAKTAVARGRPA